MCRKCWHQNAGTTGVLEKNDRIRSRDNEQHRTTPQRDFGLILLILSLYIIFYTSLSSRYEEKKRDLFLDVLVLSLPGDVISGATISKTGYKWPIFG